MTLFFVSCSSDCALSSVTFSIGSVVSSWNDTSCVALLCRGKVGQHKKCHSKMKQHCLLKTLLKIMRNLMNKKQKKVSFQDETTLPIENVTEDNAQSDEKETKKPTFAQSWRKVITLRWKE